MSDNLIVFTDGSYRKKYNYCGYGVHFPNKEWKSYGNTFNIKPLTNQRAELYAILSAFKRIKKIIESNPKIKIVDIYSDSKYSINSLTIWFKKWIKNDWKNMKGEAVINQEIIKPILSMISNIQKSGIIVNFHHVHSHTGNKDYASVHNDIADKLANLVFNKQHKS